MRGRARSVAAVVATLLAGGALGPATSPALAEGADAVYRAVRAHAEDQVTTPRGIAVHGGVKVKR